MILLVSATWAADGTWLGPGAEAPGASVELEGEASVNAGVYGVGPQVGARAAWSPVSPVTVGASGMWVAPTATLTTVGARALVLDRPGFRIAAVARGAAATLFDGSLALVVGGVGVGAAGDLGRVTLAGALPVVGLESSEGHQGPVWVPGLWDVSASVRLGGERGVRLRAGVATSLVLVHVGCVGWTRWGEWQVGAVGNGVGNALGAGATRSIPSR